MTVPVITIDGPAASGKGTIAERAARALGFHYLDSGALYRLAALASLEAGIDLSDGPAAEAVARNLKPLFRDSRIWLEGRDVTEAIRTEKVGVAASQVAAIPGVRKALFDLQRNAAEAPGLVADGRDMGTVVFPDAPVKIFLDASSQERAHRRMLQLQEKGFSVNFERLLAEIEERDYRDRNRAVAPLVPAADALVLDSTRLSIEQVIEKALQYARQKLALA